MKIRKLKFVFTDGRKYNDYGFNIIPSLIYTVPPEFEDEMFDKPVMCKGRGISITWGFWGFGLVLFTYKINEV